MYDYSHLNEVGASKFTELIIRMGKCQTDTLLLYKIEGGVCN